MSSAKFASKLLAARDARQEALAQAWRPGQPATLFLSLNLPGAEKSPPGAAALFSWMRGELGRTFPGLAWLASARDALGPYALAGLASAPLAAKRICIGLEEKHPSARLIDLDVYAGSGKQIDRASLALPARRCLVCTRPAVDCIRAKRHPFDEVIGKAHELLAHFGT
jgi:holo-ACP synthase